MEKQSVERILERIDEHHDLLEEHHKYAQRILDSLKDDMEKLVKAYELLDRWSDTRRELNALRSVFAAVYAEIERLRRERLRVDAMDFPAVQEAWERSKEEYNRVVLCVGKTEKILGEALLQEEGAFKQFREHKCEIDNHIANIRLGELEYFLGEFRRDIANCRNYAGSKIEESVDSLREVCTDIHGKITEL